VASPTERRTDQPRRPRLRASTGLCLAAAGAILLLAVHVRTDFVSLPIVGLILLGTGLSWLWFPVRDKRAALRIWSGRLRHGAGRAMRYLEWEAASGRNPSCSLGDLLESGRAGPADQ
jgi:hypothetical protein